MNKNYRSYSLLMGFLSLSSLSFSMGNVPKIIYYGSKAIASSFLPLTTITILHITAKDSEKIVDLPDVKSQSPIVQEWAENIIEKSSGSKDYISMKYYKEWTSCSYKNKKYIMLPCIESILLESALKQQHNENRWQEMTFFEKFKEGFFGSSDKPMVSLKNYNQHIDESSMVLKHEIGHIVANDSENLKRMKIAIPIAVETVCFGTSYAFKKFCKISPPKTIMKSLGRSTFAFAGIFPKVWSLPLIYRPYSRYREAEADRFACQNAATRNELEAFYDFWKNNERDFLNQVCHSKKIASEKVTEKMLRSEHDEFDSVHPYHADRAQMVQHYINKWDAEHPEDKQ